MKRLFCVIFAVLILGRLFGNEINKRKNYKFSYFPFINNQRIENYNFLSTTLPRSIKLVIAKQGNKTIDIGNNKINDVYNRKQIIAIGKNIKTDIIVCGEYKIIGTGITSKIQLIVLAYDIKGGERVLQKLIIGGTGSSLFVLVDEASRKIKKEIKKYFYSRSKILAKATKERLERESLSNVNRESILRTSLQKQKFKSKMNDSMYLQGYTTEPGVLKINTWTNFKSFEQAQINTKGPSKLPDTYYQISSMTLFLNLATGIAKNLEIWVDCGYYLFRNSYGIKGTPDPSEFNNKAKFFNPVLGFKWRCLQDENHGINMAISIAFQPSLSEKMISGTIFVPSVVSTMSSYYFKVDLNKTIGNFTPFISVNFLYNRFHKGTKYTDSTTSKVIEIIGFEHPSNKYFTQLYIDIGVEWRAVKWFISQVYFMLGFASDQAFIYSHEMSPDWSRHAFIQSMLRYNFNINFIFLITYNVSLAVNFCYTYMPDVTYQVDIYTPNYYGTWDFTEYYSKAFSIRFWFQARVDL